MIRKLLTLALIVAAIIAGFWLFGTSGGRPELDSQIGKQPPSASFGITQMSAAEVTTGWNRFRGPNGSGISDDAEIPIRWSDTENLAWKTELPGYGASSPVLTDRFVFLTTYSGYGTDVRNPGDINQLKRQLLCIGRNNGKIVWTREFPSTATEDPYQGMGVPEHGYATNTPVTDGKRVFAFLGKSGVVAFDLDGNELWRESVGTGSSNRRWGSSASLILVNNLVIVNAAEESKTIYALNADTGDVAWESEAATLELCFSTPAIRHIDNSRSEILIAVPGEVWALNPANGKLTWYIETTLTGNLSPSIIVGEDKAYAFGGYQSSGSLAIDLSQPGKVTDKNVIWTSRSSSYVATPVLLNHRFHWIDDKGFYYCTDAKSGELVFRKRVPGIRSGGRPVYASPVAIHGKIYAQTRTSGLFVIEPAEDLEIVAHNKFESDESVFNATPAVDNGQLFLRSDQCLYCVAKIQKE